MLNKNNSIKQDRFRSVASKRVQKVLDSLENLSKCSNKNNYQYTNADVAKMLKAIKDQVRVLELSYSDKQQNDTKIFKF